VALMAAENQHYLRQFFAYDHLPPNLQAASRPFAGLAELLDGLLTDNPEKSACMRKLLEAKDCAVRALIYQDAKR
jgi:hypothetical protein